MFEAIILGTAAAEGVPALFCGCEACKRAREAGGKELRARQSLFIAPDILIDLGPDCLYAVHRFGLDWSGVEAILYTHSHDDHCQPSQLGYLRTPTFASSRSVAKTTLFGNEDVRAKIAEEADGNPDVEVKPAVPFEPIALPNATATPIRSYHRPADQEVTLNYILERDGRTLLYALDTGSYDDETWEFLATQRLDAVMMECTFGTKPSNPEWPFHLGLPDVVKMKERLEGVGAVNGGTRFIITHFSHNGVAPHDEFTALAAPHGIEVAYDGLRVRV